jgi:predicted NAD/FAD-dependent oxidoreductase
VVGGGISGLHCARTLAQYGYTVSLFDMGRSGPGMQLLTAHAVCRNKLQSHASHAVVWQVAA